MFNRHRSMSSQQCYTISNGSSSWHRVVRSHRREGSETCRQGDSTGGIITATKVDAQKQLVIAELAIRLLDMSRTGQRAVEVTGSIIDASLSRAYWRNRLCLELPEIA